LFWKRKTIRPDIVLEYIKDGIPQKVIVDTKWKVPANGKPSDDDLKQMFVYNVQFDASTGILLYPAAEGSAPTVGHYAESLRLPQWLHGCHMRHAHLFNPDGSLLRTAGLDLLNMLV
jgi:5-methylcytosine-specific restriction enzyme subunit McrC